MQLKIVLHSLRIPKTLHLKSVRILKTEFLVHSGKRTVLLALYITRLRLCEPKILFV